MRRTTTRNLSAAASVGVLALGLVACGGADEGAEEPTTSATATSSAPTESPSASQSATASGSAAPTASESATSSATASGSVSAQGSAEIEAAIKTVMGEEAQILTSAQLREASESMQGVTDSVTIEPAECGTGEGGTSMAFPEDAEMLGGILTDTSDPAAPSSQVLSTVTFVEAEQGTELVSDAREFAQKCSTFTLDMGGGITATNEVTMEDVSVEDVDDVLAYTSDIEVQMEGATLPPGANQSTTTTVYVLSGDTLYQYVQAGQIESAEALENGQDLIEQLRTELGR